MPTYIHQQDGWIDFRWDSEALMPLLGKVRHLQGQLMGRMAALGFALRPFFFVHDEPI